MKIETIVTAVIFFSVGFLAGFIYKSQQQPSVPAPAAAAVAPSAVPPSAGAMGVGGNTNIDPATGLPNGHPPLEVARIIQSYEQRANQNPQDAQIPLELANYLYDNKYFNLAINWYQRSLKLNPGNINARTDLGTCYFYTGQAQQAITEYKKTLALNPNHQPTIFNLIVVNLEGTHDLRTATKYWNQLDRQNPNYPGLKDIKGKLDEAAARSGGSAMTP
ncbi:MAG TPA: tetratricopeptide repeat protein [Terriglobia bacterium]|nr:tetratricopeptide repeat protein [Terriglobia bacterium]